MRFRVQFVGGEQRQATEVGSHSVRKKVHDLARVELECTYESRTDAWCF